MIVILGASGVIGSHLYTMTVDAGEHVLGTSFRTSKPGLQQFDIRQDSLLELAPGLNSSDTVVVLSAFTNPNWIFENRDEAYDTNVIATCQVIDEARSRDAGIVFLSTEIVFPDNPDGHTEESTPDPSTEYARQKVEVEDYLLSSSGKAIVARTGWNVSSDPTANCPVLNTRSALLSGNAKMARDNWFTVTDVTDTCAALLALIKQQSNGIFHIAANPPLSRIELAEGIIASSAAGAEMSYEEIDFADLSYPEPRPATAWLQNGKLSQETGQKFSSPLGTIKRKVSIIEAHLSEPEGNSR